MRVACALKAISAFESVSNKGIQPLSIESDEPGINHDMKENQAWLMSTLEAAY